MQKKNSVLSDVINAGELRHNALIWFGAGVSISEILTGTYFAPLGFEKGLLAIFTGHFIGCVLFFLAGLIGAKTGKSAMETVKISFGSKGACLFSVLNIVQLAGWTIVMILAGSSGCASVFGSGFEFLWIAFIGLLIVVWVAVDVHKFDRLNMAAFLLLFVLSVVLCITIFKKEINTETLCTSAEVLSFGAAVELAVAMPLSWLPLAADYTKNAQKPVLVSGVSAAVYFITSCWMYFIGISAAILTGENDVVQIMIKAGLGIVAFIIVVFSTATTTYLDVYSAGISSKSLSNKLNEKIIACAVCAIGVVSAIIISKKSLETSFFENFLYFIGSVFAPMVSVQIADYFIIKNDSSEKNFNWLNLIIWFFGFVLYRFLMNVEFILGSTFLVMLIVCAAAVAANALKNIIKRSPKRTIS